MRLYGLWQFLACLAIALIQPAWADSAAIHLASVSPKSLFRSPDAMLAQSLQDIRASRLDSALKEIDQLLALHPDFKLAHLIRGDLLMARVRPLTNLGEAPASSAQTLNDLRDEARVRLMRYLDEPKPGRLPRQLLQMSASQKFALLADAERARLYVFENVDGEPRLVRDYYMTVGRNGVDKRVEGDKKTPVGVYTISDWIPRSRLTDFYGVGAFPLSYPNEWDLSQGRTGHGIWLHGTPSNTYSRAPRASDGCVVIANPDMVEIAQYIEIGQTPIIIGDRAEWLDREAWLAARNAVLGRLAQWKEAWENRDADSFLAQYSPAFLAGEGLAWAETKRRNIVGKDWIKLELSDVSVFLYPAGDMAVVTFDQHYQSDKLQDVSRKRLYLKLEEGAWRVALEKGLGAPRVLAARAP